MSFLSCLAKFRRSLQPLAAGSIVCLSLCACDNIKIRREKIPGPEDEEGQSKSKETEKTKPLKPSAKVRTQKLCETSCQEEGLRTCSGLRFIQNEDNCAEHCVPSMTDTLESFNDEACSDALLSLFECSLAQPCVEAAKLMSIMGGDQTFHFTELGPCMMPMAAAMQACHREEPDETDGKPGDKPNDKPDGKPDEKPDEKPDQKPDAPLAEFSDQVWYELHGLAVPVGGDKFLFLLSEEPIDNCDTPEYVRNEFIHFKTAAKEGTTNQALVTFRTSEQDIEVLGDIDVTKVGPKNIELTVNAGIPGIAHVGHTLSARRCPSR